MKTTLLIISFMTTIISGSAQTNYNHQTLTIFKNGLVFIEKTTEIDVQNKQAILYPLPFSSDKNTPVVIGSLQLKAANNAINTLKFTRQNVGDNKPVYYDNMYALFKNNIGAEIDINTEKETIKGTLKNILQEVGGQEKLMIASTDRFHFIPIYTVTNVNFIKNPQAIIEEEGEWVYELQFAKNGTKQSIAISYVQKGMTWIPNYYLDFEKDQTATLKLNATLINDIEDFENAEVNLAVGFPSFRFENIESPLTQTRELEGQQNIFVRREEANYSPLGANQMLSEQDLGARSFALPANGNQEDLHFFKNPSVSAKKGSRIEVPLFETKIHYEDVYKATLPPNMDDYGKWNDRVAQENNKVTHHVEFKNETGFPFTTGSLLFRKKEDNQLKFLSQGQLNYTPASGKADPEMSVVADVRILEKDKETNREEILDQYNRAYYLITVESTIEITNYKPESIAMEIDKLISGTLKKSDVKWNVETEIAQKNNPKNEVTWKLNAPAGKTTVIVYSYQYYSN